MERKFSKSMSATARALRARLPDAPPVRGLATARAPSLTLTRRAVLGAPRASRSDERSVARSLPPSLPPSARGWSDGSSHRARCLLCLPLSLPRGERCQEHRARVATRRLARASSLARGPPERPPARALLPDRPPASLSLPTRRGSPHSRAREAGRRQHETRAAPRLHLWAKFTACFFGGPRASRGWTAEELHSFRGA